MIAYTPVGFNFLETLAEIFFSPARQHQFIEKVFFVETTVRRTAIGMKTNSLFKQKFFKNPFWNQYINFGQFKLLRGGRLSIVNFDAVDNYGLNDTTKKSMKFEGDILSKTFQNLKHLYVIVFDLISMHDATEFFIIQKLKENDWISFSFKNTPLKSLYWDHAYLLCNLTNFALFKKKHLKWKKLAPN